MLRAAVVLLLPFVIAASSAPGTVRVRGELVWTADRQTLSVCESEHTYYLRVLASNPHFALSKRVDSLTAAGAHSLVAEFEGSVHPSSTSISPPYATDGTLQVSRIISVDEGRCP